MRKKVQQMIFQSKSPYNSMILKHILKVYKEIADTIIRLKVSFLLISIFFATRFTFFIVNQIQYDLI
jgi:hypothetical protein